MTKVDYTLSLSPEQRRFFDLVEKLEIAHLWDIKSREYESEAVDRYLGTASHGQAIMLRFCLGAWTHNNDYKFDFIEAASTLDADNMKLVTEWMANPFWP